MKFPILILTAGVLSVPAFAQNEAPTFAVPVVPVAPAPAKPRRPEPSNFDDIIRAKFPLAIEFGDLGAGWREISYSGSTYYTKGDTTWVNDREYLVAYTFGEQRTKSVSARDYVSTVTRGTTPHSPKERLSITLLDLRKLAGVLTSGTIGLKSFDAADYEDDFTIQGLPSAYYQNLSLVYLRKLNTALTAYSNAYLSTMPVLETAFAARQALEPFAENPAIFTQPGTNQPFKANPLLSGRKRAHLKGKGYVVVFYEGVPAPDGSRAVLYYNGRVQRVSAKQWEKVKANSKLD
jgi:hypothetical protein